MNQKFRTLLCLLLSLTLLFGLCACGDEEVEEPTYDPANYDLESSYHVNKNQDGTYSFSVVDYTGNTFFSREGEHHQPEFVKLSDAVLQVTVPMRNAPQHRWAVFCNVRAPQASNIFGNFLAAKGNYVAQLEQLTDQYHVFVREIFKPDVEPQVTTLTGLEINKDGYLYEKAELNKDGDLEIVYNTKDGKKTVIVEMP